MAAIACGALVLLCCMSFFVEADFKKQCLPFEKIKMLTSYN